MKRLLVLLPLVLLLSACNPAAAWEALWSEPVVVIENCSGTSYVDGKPVNYDVEPGVTAHYELDTATQTRDLKVVCSAEGELVGSPTLIIHSTAPVVVDTEPSSPISKPVADLGFTNAMVAENSLVNPELFDAQDNAAGLPAGLHDVGPNPGQFALAFGYHLKWGELDAGGDGCDIVVFPPGWYEDVSIEDGRVEFYTIPSSDYIGWADVLVTQRIAEQNEHYGCYSSDYSVKVWTEDGFSTSWAIWMAASK